ncbi:hypothetical protein DFJ63DRAFT_315449 [Scheffersomyces coipomensis]|uniref:uncharacterized protein n=1 Tax=Scheffersomyces coipomensis TaxID=1788519 RepID=UPI00315DD1D0
MPPSESSSNLGRSRLSWELIEVLRNRKSTFFKRLKGIIGGGLQINKYTGCEIAILVSFEGEVYSHCTCDLNEILDKHKATDPNSKSQNLCKDIVRDLIKKYEAADQGVRIENQVGRSIDQTRRNSESTSSLASSSSELYSAFDDYNESGNTCLEILDLENDPLLSTIILDLNDNYFH